MNCAAFKLLQTWEEHQTGLWKWKERLTSQPGTGAKISVYFCSVGRGKPKAPECGTKANKLGGLGGIRPKLRRTLNWEETGNKNPQTSIPNGGVGRKRRRGEESKEGRVKLKLRVTLPAPSFFFSSLSSLLSFFHSTSILFYFIRISPKIIHSCGQTRPILPCIRCSPARNDRHPVFIQIKPRPMNR
jgi:hypothetical protein